QGGSGGMLAQTQELLRQLLGRPMLRPHQIKAMQPPEDWAELWRVPHQLTQLARPGEATFYLGGRIAFGHTQGWAQSSLDQQLLLELLRALRQRLEQLQGSGQVGDRLRMHGPLRRLLPG